MYCPSCFNQTLHLNKSGVVEIRVDGKQMDSGRFLFNVEMESREVARALDKKINEFMTWYGNFKNKDPIEKVEIVTNAVVCTEGCKIPLSFKYNIVGDIITLEKVKEMLNKYAQRNKIVISPNLNV